MVIRAILALVLIVFGVAALQAPPAAAQDFSDKPIRIIVGLAPGGATDVTARLIAQRLTQSLNTNV
jgi:tripartite-type tricarboxylate transporter receptor subunit TctC